MKNFTKEFKEFIMRGNVVDLAVGVVIGGAFGAIVTSLVNDIITPLISLALGSTNFEHLAWVVGEASINYGLFIQAILNFIIIAFAIFMVIKLINRMKKPVEEEPVEDLGPTETQLLQDILTELRRK